MDTRTPLFQRYPYDLLRSIFQEVLEDICPPDSHMLVATTLSSVCRNWRDVALRCPFLWRYITFPMRRIESVSEMAQTLVSRTSMVPVIINVDYAGAYNKKGIPPRGALNHCLLDRFPAIHALKFRFDTAIEEKCMRAYMRRSRILDLTNILDDAIRLPKKPVDQLSILRRNTESESHRYRILIKGGEFVERFTPRSLQLDFPGFSLSHKPKNWSTLQELSLSTQQFTPTISQSIPNVISLKLSHNYSFHSFDFWLGTDAILLPNLQVLDLDHSPRFDGNTRIQCPNLQKLTITLPQPGSWKLFSLNSELAHLTTLILNVNPMVFGEIASFLPQIKVLSATTCDCPNLILEILSNWLEWDLEEPFFPSLQDLSFDMRCIDEEDVILSPSTFNDLIRNRLLPFGHPDRGTNAANAPIQRLIIREDVDADEEWLNSPYIEFFDFEKSENSKERIVTMKWPTDR